MPVSSGPMRDWRRLGGWWRERSRGGLHDEMHDGAFTDIPRLAVVAFRPDFLALVVAARANAHADPELIGSVTWTGASLTS